MRKDRISTGLSTLYAAMLAAAFMTGVVPVQAAEQAKDEEALFEEGMQALDDDRLKTAMKAFQSILSQQPGLHRARLELAVAYYRSLQYAEARKLAQTVLDDPQTPPEVRVTVLAFLAQIQKDEAAMAVRHEFNPSISAGFMYDSNVNVGPSSDLVEGNPQLVLLPGSQAQSDNALVLAAGLAHRFQPGKTYQFGEQTASFLWQSQVSLYDRAYNDMDDFDLTILTGSTGPALIVLNHWRANLALNVDRIWLGGSELAVFTSLNPAVTWQFNNGELTWDATVTDRSYDNDASTLQGGDGGREGTYAATGVTLGRYFNNRKIAGQVGAHVLDFSADEDRYGNNGYELLAGVIVKAWPNGTVFARANYRDVEYDAIDPGFAEARDEQEERFSAGFQHDIKAGYLEKWTVNGGIQYTDNKSNISIYEYDRRQITLNLGRTF
ncbi:MAG: tetratricopeptide repeat protein [Gammaproteobacteria bacterium]|nr:tetratricopeptide repeat protein [Gammaproteobacteria bacterium]